MAARLTAEFLKDWRNDVNPDLQKERDTATFKTDELTCILDGGAGETKCRKELEKLLFEDNAETFSMKRRPFLTKSELYEDSLGKSVKLFALRRDLQWSDDKFGLACRIINYDLAIGLHHTMFVPAIERLATDEQKSKWLPLALSYKIIGTYAQTELGHGTNLMALETTATFDRQKDEFVLNTPRLSSMKWWPGSLGKSSTHAVVLAQLVIGNTKCGMHPFIVQLRSLDDHTPMPGIELGDIGPKLGANNVDNGYMILNNVRIPRQNMFMRNAMVSRDGKFKQTANSKANYATMMLVRVTIVSWAFDMLMQASCASIRYSAVRRQTTLKPGTPEQQVLDFQTQQYKTFPALAATYAMYFTEKAIRESYYKTYNEIQQGNTSKLAELHAQTSGLKALGSDMCARLVEICRRSCGGHGYLISTGISVNMQASLSLITVEGENTVLYLQTARYLMKQIANSLAGNKLDDCTQYFSRDFAAYTCPIQSSADCRNLSALKEVCRQRAHRLVLSVAQKLQMDMEAGLEQDVTLNKNMVALVRAAKAHMHLWMVEYYVDGVQSLQSTSSSELSRVLHDLCCFYTIHNMVLDAADFLETESLNLSEMEWMREEEMKLLAVIRPNAVALVDSFDLHDETVSSVLGYYDGNAYQHLYESTKYEPMNKTEVHPSYYKHLRGLLKGTNSKL